MGDTATLAGRQEPGRSVKWPKVPGGKMKQRFRELKETMALGPNSSLSPHKGAQVI